MVRAALIALALVACKHSQDQPVTGAASQLTYLPGDAQLVMHIDLDALRASALWKQYEPKVRLLIGSAMDNITKTCGFDPITAPHSLTFAGTTDDGDGVFVIKGLERDKTIKCLESQVIPQTKATNDNGIVSLKNDSGALNMVTFADPTTAVAEGSTHPTKESLAKVLATAAPLEQAAWFRTAAANADRSATVWAAISGTSPKMARFEPIGKRPESVLFTIKVSDRLDIKVFLQALSPADAKTMADGVRAQMSPMAGMFEKTDVTTANNVVTVTASMTNEQFSQFVAGVAAMFGG